MHDLLLASVVVLWVLVLVLLVGFVALARQVGLLHERLAPAGALTPGSGPTVGEDAPQLDVQTLTGDTLRVGAPASHGLLLLFVSPTCPVCKSLVPVARALAADESRRLRLAFASDGDTAERHRDYVREQGLGRFPYIVSQALGLTFGVGKLPFAVLIGPDGVLRGKGLVNSREHLESLVEAWDSGHHTLQDYLQAAGTAGVEEETA